MCHMQLHFHYIEIVQLEVVFNLESKKESEIER